MNIDTHWHVIVPTMTRELSGGSEPWRPSVRWQNGEQIVELASEVRPQLRLCLAGFCDELASSTLIVRPPCE